MFTLQGHLTYPSTAKARGAEAHLLDLGIRAQRSRTVLSIDTSTNHSAQDLCNAAEPATLGKLLLESHTPPQRIWLYAGGDIHVDIHPAHPKLMARLGSRAFRSVASPHWAAVSPDGNRIAIGNGIFDADTGELITRFPSGQRGCWSPDGSALYTVTRNDAVYRLDLTTGQHRRRRLSWCRDVWAAPREAYVIAGSTVLNAKTLKPIATLPHEGTPFHVAISSDGRRVVSGTTQGGVHLWDPVTWRLTETLFTTPDQSAITSLCWIPGSSTLLIQWKEGDTLPFTALALDGEEPVKLPDAIPSEPMPSPDGQRILGIDTHAGPDWAPQQTRPRLVVRERESGALVSQVHVNAHPYACWHPNGAVVFAQVGNMGVLPHDVETGERRPDLQGHTGHVYDIAFSPDGTRVITTGFNDSSVRVQTVEGEAIAELHLGMEPFQKVLWRRDWLIAHLATYGAEPTVFCVLDPDTLEVTEQLPAASGVGSVALSPDREQLAWSGPEGLLLANVDSLDGPRLLRLPRNKHRSLPQVRGLDFSADGSLLIAALYNGSVMVWDLDRISQKPLVFDVGLASLRGFAQLPGGRMAVAGKGASIGLWTFSGEHIREVPSGEVNSLASSDRFLAAAHTEAQKVCLWDIANLDDEPEVFMGSTPTCLAFSPDEQLLAVGSKNGEVVLWKVS